MFREMKTVPEFWARVAQSGRCRLSRTPTLVREGSSADLISSVVLHPSSFFIPNLTSLTVFSSSSYQSQTTNEPLFHSSLMKLTPSPTDS